MTNHDKKITNLTLTVLYNDQVMPDGIKGNSYPLIFVNILHLGLCCQIDLYNVHQFKKFTDMMPTFVKMSTENT